MFTLQGFPDFSFWTLVSIGYGVLDLGAVSLGIVRFYAFDAQLEGAP